MLPPILTTCVRLQHPEHSFDRDVPLKLSRDHCKKILHCNKNNIESRTLDRRRLIDRSRKKRRKTSTQYVTSIDGAMLNGNIGGVDQDFFDSLVLIVMVSKRYKDASRSSMKV